MKSEQRKRVAARFARLWKRDIRADEGARYRRVTRRRLRLAAEKRSVMIVITIVAAAALIFLWILRRFSGS